MLATVGWIVRENMLLRQANNLNIAEGLSTMMDGFMKVFLIEHSRIELLKNWIN
jgi:hypothetical protein